MEPVQRVRGGGVEGAVRAITYGSVCSGIEAASVAWEPLGMTPEWFAEIEPFPCAVLAHHWPDVANLGDMTIIPTVVDMGYMPAPDILVGGTPCQAYSVAGKREGLSDPRGMLTLKFVEIADAIDRQRDAGDECVIVWENVPGVLSSKDNAFGCFLGDLAGEDCELVPPGRKWSNAGCVFGPKRTVAWRILDAQYFGVAQRRRRVFVVASARKDFDPTAVLFEREGVRRDTAPRHQQQPSEHSEHATIRAFDMLGFGQYGEGLTASTCKARDYKDATDLVVMPDGSVRRLMPVECERLQDFPDGHTNIPWRTYQEALRKSFSYETMLTQRGMTLRGPNLEDCPDGPRYKAIGNSMAVCCMSWIGQRILSQLNLAIPGIQTYALEHSISDDEHCALKGEYPVEFQFDLFREYA